jgi:tRNA 2-thiouridine synthesizing protein E
MNDEMSDKEKMEFVFGVREDDEPVVEDWNRDVATELAKDEGIDLSDAHWDVVSFLRKHFDEVGTIDYARDLSAVLNQHFEKQGGLKYLYTLFPSGPVSQGCKVAGIPLPKDSRDPSFGNTA